MVENHEKWNVTPLLGDFGGRVGIYRFLQSPPIPRRLPSLFICRELFSFCHFNSIFTRSITVFFPVKGDLYIFVESHF